MKIVYNTSDTANCPEYNFNGQRVNVNGLEPLSLKQVSDAVALDMVDRWGFVEIVTKERAEKIVEDKKKKSFKCEQCDFTTSSRIGLEGHKKGKHKEPKNEVEEVLLEDDIAPVDTPKKVINYDENEKAQYSLKNDMDIPNGIDKDGVTWTGDGLTEENNSFQKVRKAGDRHFKGEL